MAIYLTTGLPASEESFFNLWLVQLVLFFVGGIFILISCVFYFKLRNAPLNMVIIKGNKNVTFYEEDGIRERATPHE